MTKYAVLGAGHGGLAMASFMKTMDNYVSLWNRTPENIRLLKADNKIHLEYRPEIEDHLYPLIDPKDTKFESKELVTIKDMYTKKKEKEEFIRTTVQLDKISSDIEYILNDPSDCPDVLMVVVPAFGHKYVAKTIAPYLKDNQVVLLNPGRMLGALEFYQTVKDYYKKKKKDMPDVAIGETGTLVYACRSRNEKFVRIHGIKNNVNVSAIPSEKAKRIIDYTKDVYPQFNKVKNTGITSFWNVSGALHVVPAVLNVNLISAEDVQFLFYKEGITPGSIALVEMVDEERVQVAEAMGMEKIKDLKGWIKEVYGQKGATTLDAIHKTYAYSEILAPTEIDNRYFKEDVPYVLETINSFGEQIGVPCKMTKSFIIQAEGLFSKTSEKPLLENARTTKNLKLDKLNKRQIIKYIETGKHPLGDI